MGRKNIKSNVVNNHGTDAVSVQSSSSTQSNQSIPSVITRDNTRMGSISSIQSDNSMDLRSIKSMNDSALSIRDFYAEDESTVMERVSIVRQRLPKACTELAQERYEEYVRCAKRNRVRKMFWIDGGYAMMYDEARFNKVDSIPSRFKELVAPFLNTILVFFWQLLMFIGVVLPCLALKYISVSALPWITVARQEFRVGMYADHIDGKVCNTRRALSLVNATTPRLYADYLRLVSVGSAALRDLKYNLAGVENVQTLNKPNHNLANFLCHLNAASYEDDIVLSTFIFKLRELFNDDLEFHRFGHDRGMVLVVWSVISNFVCISFKGSSPLHLAQYVMNTGTQKRFSATGMFRGGVHTTAYDALQLPNTSYNKTQAEMPRGIYTGEEPQQVPLVYAISNFITDVVLPSFEPRSDRAPKPQLWISGFGLGGATASLFTATILHTSRDELGLHHTTPSLNWDDIFTLRGTYTFGAPPVGDEEFRRSLEILCKGSKDNDSFLTYQEYPFHNFVNGNDIVSSGSFSGVSFVFPEGADWVVPSFQLREDSLHVGSMYKMMCRDECDIQTYDADEIGSQRSLQDIYNNVTQTFKSALRKLVNSDTWPSDGLLDPVNLMQIGTLGTFSFVKDHLPSSYIASIQKRYPPALKMGQTEKSLTKRTSSYVLFLKEQ